MITELELNQLIIECEENAEQCRRAREAAVSFGNKTYADSQQREGKKWLAKRDYYLTCKDAIGRMTLENMERQRNELMIKANTIHDRAFNHIWAETKTKPDLKNPLTKKKYDDHCKQYNMPDIKRQIKHLNFILQ